MKKTCAYNTLTASSCHNQRVLLRADLNVPVSGFTIDDDFRLQELRPTLDLLLGQHATIVLVTHIGRPHKKNEPVISTTIITEWLNDHGYRAFFAPTSAAAHEQSKNHSNTVIVLENSRTFPGEMTHDITFAQELSTLGDCYVNDAFGTLHRDDTSISLVPTFFAPEKRFIGLLVARELHALAPLVDTPAHPFVVVIGGGKVADKLPLIKRFIETADTLLLCPAIAFTFMKAHGLPVGASLVDDSQLTYCKELLAYASTTKTQILLPTDLQVAATTIDGELAIKNSDQLTSNDVGITLGPVSTARYGAEITRARTIFFNAVMGFTTRPETLVPAKTLIEAIGASSAYGVIGGGDSVALANNCTLGTGIHHLSTGGGATLTYISGKSLPGLEALCANDENKN